MQGHRERKSVGAGQERVGAEKGQCKHNREQESDARESFKAFCVSRVASTHSSHRLKRQEVSPQAVTKQGGDLKISISQLKRDLALQITPSSLWIPVLCTGKWVYRA